MSNYKAIVCLLVMLVLPQLALSNNRLPDFYSESGFNPNRDYVDSGGDVSIDPFGGNLHIKNVDLKVIGDGGFELAIARSYTSRNGSLPGSTHRSIVGAGWKFHFGRILGPWSNWHCGSDDEVNQASDNPVLELSDGRRVPLRRPDGGQSGIYGSNYSPANFYVSADRWIVKCQYNALDTEFIVKSPDGTVYEISKKINGKAEWYVKKITDKNGNYASFSYYGDGEPFSASNKYPLIRKITLSNSNTVEFKYYDIHVERIDHVRLKSISYDNKTWQFSYSLAYPSDHNYYLKEVTRPDGSKWQYKYETSQSNPGFGNIEEIVDPFGKQSTFTYLEEQFTPGFLSSAVKRMEVSGDASVPLAIWDYDYSPGHENFVAGDLDQTTVKGPESTVIYRHYGFQAAATTPGGNGVWRTGMLHSRFICDAGSSGNSCAHTGAGICVGGCTSPNQRQKEVFAWDIQAGTVADYVQYPRGLTDYSGGIPYLKKHTVTRDGTEYVTENLDIDDYGNFGRILESGQSTKRTDRDFFANKDRWIVNQVEKEEVHDVEGTTDIVLVDRGFDTRGNMTHECLFGTYSIFSGCSSGAIHTAYTYDGKGQVTQETNARGWVTRYSDYKRGLPQRTDLPAGVTEYQAVNNNGTVAMRTDGEGIVTGFGYDALFRLSGVNYPEGADAALSRPVSNGVTQSLVFTQGRFRETREYNILGLVDRRTRTDTSTGESIVVTYRYDAEGRLVFKSLPNSAQGVTFTYDPTGRVLRTTFADSTYTSHAYLPGNKVAITNQRGHTTTYSYRSFGNPDDKELIRVDAPHGIATVINRDRLGNIRSVVQGGITRTFKYNGRYQLIERNDPETTRVTFGRDQLGNMTSRRVNAMGTTTFGYDGLNRLAWINYAEAGTPDVVRTYDKNSNLVEVDFGSINKSFTYDNNDRLRSERLSIVGTQGTKVFDISYVLDDLGSVAEIHYPSGRMIDYSPDGFGRSTKAAPFVTAATHFPSGRLQSLQFENGVRTDYTQSVQRLWLSSIKTTNGGSLIDLNYGYDQVGNLTSLHDKVLSPSQAYQLNYDGLDRLVSASGPWGNASYGYDAVGNIRSTIIGGQGATYVYDGTNRLMSIDTALPLVYNYDGYGNVSGRNADTYDYDEAGNLVTASVGQTIDYLYDGENRLAVRDTDQGTTYFFYNRDGHLLAEMDPTGRINTENIYLDGQLVGSASGVNSAPLPPVIHALGAENAMQGRSIRFDASQSQDVDGDVLTFHWDFGDGTVKTGVLAYHTYDTPGDFTVTLTASDGERQTSSTMVVSVAVSTGPSPSETAAYLIPILHLLLH